MRTLLLAAALLVSCAGSGNARQAYVAEVEQIYASLLDGQKPVTAALNDFDAALPDAKDDAFLKTEPANKEMLSVTREARRKLQTLTPPSACAELHSKFLEVLTLTEEATEEALLVVLMFSVRPYFPTNEMMSHVSKTQELEKRRDNALESFRSLVSTCKKS